MQIPGGDLAPARRRRYGGSYGRRRRRRTLGLAILVMLALAGAAYYYAHREPGQAAVKSAAPKSCATPKATPLAKASPLPGEVRVELFNGTSRNGLAASVGTALEGRGFQVPVKDTAPAALPGPTRVEWGPGGEGAAALVVSHIKGAVGVSAPRIMAGTVQVTLGNEYERLATLEEIAAASAAALPTATPTPTCAA